MQKIYKSLKLIIISIIKLLIKLPKYFFSTSPNRYISILCKNIKVIKNKTKFEEKHFVKKCPINDNEAQKQEEIKHREIARQCKLGIVEIGILLGETSKILAESNPNIPVYGIDPIILDSMSSSLIGNIETIKKNTKNVNNFYFIKDYSYFAINNWNKPFDYIFIDGSHKYDDVKKDVEDWLPKLAKGGIISLHDSTMNRGGLNYWEGPSKVADELIFNNKIEFVESIARLTILKKL